VGCRFQQISFLDKNLTSSVYLLTSAFALCGAFSRIFDGDFDRTPTLAAHYAFFCCCINSTHCLCCNAAREEVRNCVVVLSANAEAVISYLGPGFAFVAKLSVPNGVKFECYNCESGSCEFSLLGALVCLLFLLRVPRLEFYFLAVQSAIFLAQKCQFVDIKMRFGLYFAHF
jgi:hypothetical protein